MAQATTLDICLEKTLNIPKVAQLSECVNNR